MRPIRPDGSARRERGFTLIEMVVAIVLTSIIVGTTIYFVYPVLQTAELSTRAELTDIADNALQRIGREVRLALPNSVRVDGSRHFLEFIPVRSAGRYRVESTGAACDTATDELAFGAIDTCFKSIGTVANASTIAVGDFVVLSNYGTGFPGQNAYETAGTNWRRVTSAVDEGTRERIIYTPSTAFDRTLHDSPGKRFFVVNGNVPAALPEPVTYDCDTTTNGTLTRRWGYAMTEAQPTSFGGGSASLIAGENPTTPSSTKVTVCDFDYDPNGVAPQVGMLTLRLTLSKALPGGRTETVTLYHAVHVNNVP